MRKTVPLLSLSWCLGVGGCLFDPGVDGAALLCVDDTDCPDGRLCNVTSHTCLAPGEDDVVPPGLVSAAFEPGFTRDVAVLVITASEPVDPTALAPTFVGLTPGLAPEDDNPAATVRLVGVVDTLPAGTATLVGLTLVDVAGNVTGVAVGGASLVIDRSAPVFTGLAVHGADDDGRFADVGANEVVVDVTVDEPLTGLVGRLGARPLVCEVSGDTVSGRCRGVVTADMPDGATDIVVEAVDRAGNVATTSTAVIVDTAAPRVIAESLAVDVTDARGNPSLVLAPGGRLTLSFLLDETPLIAPQVVLTGAGDVELDVELFGRQVRASTVIGALIEGRLQLEARNLVDRHGHETAVVPLIPGPPFADGIPSLSVQVSPCGSPPGTAICPDWDGDGVAGLAPGCPLEDALDCDDTVPEVAPGHPEIPGDGLDNDCVDGDLALDDDNAVFVAADAPAGGDGTSTSPLNDLGSAVQLASASGRVVAARSGVYPCEDLTIPRGLVGGLDADWRPSSSPTRVRCNATVERFAVDATFFFVIAAAGALFVDIQGAIESDGATLIRHEGATLDVGEGDHRLVGGQIGSVVSISGRLELTDTVVGSIVAEQAELTLVRAHVQRRLDTSQVSLRAFSSVFESVGIPALSVGDSSVNLVNSVVRADGAEQLIESRRPVGLRGCAIDAPGAEIIAGFPATPEGLVGLEACATCAAADNVVGSVFFIDAELHLADTPQNVALDAGVDPFLFRAPPSVVRDIDGTCMGSPWDIGRDQR